MRPKGQGRREASASWPFAFLALRRIRGPGSRQRGAPGCYVFLRFALPHRASITFRMIARRSSGVVPAHLAACAFPAAALPPRRPSATAAGFFRFAMRRILASGRLVTCRLTYVYR